MNVSQVLDELVDDAVNKLRQLGQKWNDRLTLDNLRLAERYLKDDIEFLLLFGTGSGENSAEHCAVLHHGSLAGAETHCGRKLGRYDLPRTAAQIHNQSNAAQAKRSDQQDFMLVDNVKVMHQLEVAVPTLVRLDSPQEIFSLRADSLYLSRTRGFVTGGILAHRELCLRARRIAGGFDQLPEQVVKSAAQIVEGIADDQRQAFRDLRADVKPLDFVAGLRIVIDSDAIRVTVPEGLDDTFYITDVMVGPFDFRPDAA